ncbi:diguanylate cyclase domain-containing protein [Arenibacterium sp. CAU 1754]
MISIEEMADVLERMCPMSVLLDPTGRILKVGPTLQKLRPDTPMQGQLFLELFALKRPRAVNSMQVLLENSGTRLHLQFRDAPTTGLKGILIPLSDGKGAIVNLSFGISVLDAVRDYALSSSDFSATDLTIELLYLVEAKSAAMDASRKLNQRLQGAMIAAEEQAFTDTLTGLKNRRAMDHVLARLIGGKGPFALMHLDLDHFKQVNDTMGHAAGDHVLQKVARIMIEETRDTDTIARVGGDEFVLIFDRLVDSARLNNIAQSLIRRFEEPTPYNGQTCRISASVGTTISHQPEGIEAAALLHQADLALYAAKNAGRGTHKFYVPDMEDGAAGNSRPAWMPGSERNGTSAPLR